MRRKHGATPQCKRAGDSAPIQAPWFAVRTLHASCKDWYDNELSRPRSDEPAVRIANLRDEELVSRPLRLNFDVRGMGVAPTGFGDAKHGHFVLKVQSDRAPTHLFDFSNGAIQTTLSLPLGATSLELAFKNDAGDDDLLAPARMSIKVSPAAHQ
jgi:hypothetical protein